MSGGAKPSTGQSTRRRWLLAAAIIVTALTIVARPGRDLSNVVPPMAQFGTSPHLATPASPPTPTTVGRTATFDRLDVAGLRQVDDSAMAAVEAGSAVAGQGYAPPGRSSVVWNNKVASITGGGLVAQYCCAGAFSIAIANKTVSSGRHYWEVTLQAAPGEASPDTYTSPGVAVATGSSQAAGIFRTRTASSTGGRRDPDMLLTIGFAQGKRYRSGDTFMFALDADSRIVYQGVNGTWTNGTPGGAGGEVLGRAGDAFLPIARISASSRKPVGDSAVANFGGSNFRYPVPNGYGAYGTYSRPSAKGGAASASNAFSSGNQGDTYLTAEVLVGGRKLPLPEGRWLELARFEKYAGALLDDAVLLAKVNGPAISSIIAIRAGEAGRSYGKHRSCGRQDVLHTDEKRNEENGQQQCWWVNHSGIGWLNDPAISAAVTAAGLRGLSVPETMLNVGIRHADSAGHSLTLIYFDPADRGISTNPSGWDTSPWHVQNVTTDQSRKDYAESLVDWGKNWAPVVYAYR